MVTRRHFIQTAGTGAVALGFVTPDFSQSKKGADSKFEYCLNTSTIKGQNLSLPDTLNIASRAGYSYVELWISDIKVYTGEGKTIASLKKILDDNKLKVANAIGFAPWMVDDDEQRKKGFEQMEEEMNILVQLGCPRVAAPSSGVKSDKPLDLLKAGERYRQLLDLGRKTGVMPQLEFWGSSKIFFSLGQALMVMAVADDPDCRLLADVFHMYKGGSGFNGLKLLNGKVIEVFHMNDYLSSIPRDRQTDKNRVFPGDGIAPFGTILRDLYEMGGTKILSLELFNQDYYKRDPFEIAKTGIEKMQNLVKSL